MTSFYSTSKHTKETTLADAILHGLAPDGGLFMPEKFPVLASDFFTHLSSYSLTEIALEICKNLFHSAIPELDLKKIIYNSITFESPLHRLSEDIYVLELFHGPSLSFKDFGACFMAHLIAYFNRYHERDLNILTATSGDTGSAVAQGFLNVPGIKVWILYPKGQVSWIQEKQLTTVGSNITALEVEGTFDDCQALVKQAFKDEDLCEKVRLTSANSINIARLIPQTFYYFYAYGQLKKIQHPVLISVPSGNFGNLTAGLFAKKMGLPIDRFIAATNINDIVPKYLETGQFHPQPSKRTISNAMDVGNPSNFVRILDLYNLDWKQIRKDIFGASFTDLETRSAIQDLYRRYEYIADPHGAVAYLGLVAYQKSIEKSTGIFLETAHPAKFPSIIEPLIERKISIPERLQHSLDKEKQIVPLPNRYSDFKNLLLL